MWAVNEKRKDFTGTGGVDFSPPNECSFKNQEIYLSGTISSPTYKQQSFVYKFEPERTSVLKLLGKNKNNKNLNELGNGFQYRPHLLSTEI